VTSAPARDPAAKRALAAQAGTALVAHPIAFRDIPRAAWDRLLAITPAATPFSRWTLHRAWWDAYEPTAHEQYLVCIAPGPDDPPPGGPPVALAEIEPERICAIAPLMHRHQREPTDLETATHLRRFQEPATQVSPEAKTVFFGASYHADYATILCGPDRLEAASRAVAEALAAGPDPTHGPKDWDVVDLRRLREVDPVVVALERAFRAAAPEEGWLVDREQEDVCPVVTFESADWEAYLGTLGKHARHEIRRKIRRAHEKGDVRFRLVDPTPEAVETLIALHQARWGTEGLFPDTEGGARSRRFMHRLAELEGAEGDDRQLQMGSLEVDGRPIFATVGFDDGTTCYFYNAGLDPMARDLSPGVTGTAAYLRDRLEAGRRRFDFLRGSEPYKYEWGAVDEPIHRLLVRRRPD
jgi:hypothetical protein